MLLVIGILIVSAINAEIQLGDKSLSRANYGVFFRYHHQLQIPSDIYRVTFMFGLPKAPSVRSIPARYNRAICDRKANLMLRGTSSQGTAESEQVEQMVNRSKAFCETYTHNMELFQRISDERTHAIKETLDAIHGMIPRGEMDVVSRRRQRIGTRGALIPFIGDLGHSLFGWITNKDFGHLVAAVRTLANNTAKEMNIIRKTNAHMSSYVDISNAHFKRMEDFVWLQGHLSTTIVPEERLQEALNHVEAEVIKDSPSAQVIHKNTAYYYKYGSFIYTTVDDRLVVTLQIPVTTWEKKFDIYELQVTPVYAPGLEQVTEIINLPDIIAVEVGDEHFFAMTKLEWIEMQKTQYSIARRIIQKTKPDTCVMNLKKNDMRLVNTTCRFVLTALTNRATHWNESSYVLLNARNLTTQCMNARSALPKSCPQCILTLKPGCRFETDDFLSSIELSHSNDTEEGYIVNLALAQKLFTAEALIALTAEQLLQEPPVIKIPSLRKFEHEAKNDLSAISETRHDLEKVAMAIKTDKVIMENVAEAVAIGEIDIESDFFSSIAGIVEITTTVVVLLLMILLALLAIRVRQIMITVALLKQLAVAKGNIVLEYTQNQLKVVELGQNSTSDIGKLIIDVSTRTAPITIIILMLTTMILLILYKCIKKRWAEVTRFTRSTLTLEIISNQANILIPLKHLRGMPSEYVVKIREKVISSVQIQGWVFPLLVVHWDHTRLTDKMAGRTATLKGAYRISFITAIIARRILKQIHVFKLIWITDKTRVEDVEVEVELEMAEGEVSCVGRPPTYGDKKPHENIMRSTTSMYPSLQ